MKKLALILSILSFLVLLLPTPALADGIIIPEPPICDPGPCPPVPISQLDIRYHRVTVTIEDQIAITHVDQVFYNPNNWQVEGTYIFPIPAEAAITSFSLWIDGEAVQGQVLDAAEARARYEEIVRTMQDPALLEYAGSGAWQASIFPIPPDGERRIELEYTQALTAENGLVGYVYPLSTEKFSQRPLEDVSVSVTIKSSPSIRAVYSPSHTVDIVREGDHLVRVGYEETDVLPERDFSLYYSVGESEAFHLLTYRDPGDLDDPDGFFLLLLAPRPESTTIAVPKDVILVLDRSGSMEGEKFSQAQEALRFILRSMNEGDRFNIVTFSTGIDVYASALRPEEEANEAQPWVDRLSARGNTDINRALLEAAALAQPDRPTYLIFLTDGLPTQGEVEREDILANFQAAASDNLRLFAFGVGYDVDTFLLDTLAKENHGASAYVLPEERLDEKLSAFYEKISTPVLTDLALDFGSINAYDIYPEPLPDLFVGSQIIAAGRYRGDGVTAVTLSGKVDDRLQTFEFDEQYFSEDSREGSPVLATIPRLWATRKIGYLLNRIRLEGPSQEMLDQIVRLSIRYGIVTEYTSYLVTEDMALGDEAQARIAGEQFSEMEAMPEAPVSGQDAVRKSAEQNALEGASSAEAPSAEAADVVRIAGSRTFVLQDGIWIDTSFDPDRMQPVEVAFLSEDYFKLAAAYPELGGGFALGSQVVVVIDGTAYRVVDPDAAVQPLPDLPTRTPQQNDLPVEPNPVEPVEQPTRTPIVVAQEPREPDVVSPPEAQPAARPARQLCGSLLLPLGLGVFGVWQVKRKK